MMAQSECVHCTVPTDGDQVCTFCKNYTPPAGPGDQLAGLAHMLDEMADIASRACSRIPANAPLWSVVDATAAAAHVRTAARLLDRAAARTRTEAP